MTTRHPSAATLRRLALGGARASRATVEHVAACGPCGREVALVSVLAASRRTATGTGPCPDAELLVLLSTAKLAPSSAAPVRAHAARCEACAADLEGLERAAALAPPAPLASAASRLVEAGRALADDLRRLARLELPPAMTLATRGGAGTRASAAADRALAAYRAGDTDDALPLLARAVSDEAAPAELRLFLAACLLRAGRFDEAVTQLEALVAARPRLAEYRWHLAQALLGAGRGAEALAQLRGVIRSPGARRAAARSQAAELGRLLGRPGPE